MPDVESDGVAVRLLARVTRRVGSSLGLDETLTAIAEAVVEALGFGAAVVNLLGPDDRLSVVAIAGSDDIKAALAGTSSARTTWERMLGAAVPIGDLRLLPHDRTPPEGTEEMQFYVADGAATDADVEPGEWHPLDALFAPLVTGDGELLGVLSVDDPLDGRLPTGERAALLEAFAVQASLAIEHAHEHAQVARSEVLLERLFDQSPIAKTLMSADGRILKANRSFCRFLGRDIDEVIGQLPLAFTHPDDVDGSADLIRTVASGEVATATIEKRYVHSDGRILWGRLTAASIEAHSLGAASDGVMLGAVEDITEARAAADKLRHLALHDSLTGLPNRTLVSDRLEQGLARAARDGSRVGIAVIDIDHFKLVNDSYGHPVGDQLLVAMADSVRGVLRSFDTAGRLGGDELIVVCEGMHDIADLELVAERLRQAARLTVTIDGHPLFASASVGCTLSRPDASVEDLVAEADTALYRAKALGRGRYELFDEDMRRDSIALLELRGQFAKAMADDELVLHYQPIVDVADNVTIGYEALLRWQHPTRGLLLPGEFLDLVTDGELGHPLAQWVIERACRDLAALSMTSGPNAFVAVNLAPSQLARPELADEVAARLAAHGVEPQRLWLEVTEQQVLGPRHRGALDQLRRLGCRIALDDFGTGYCGLAYLQQLPVQVLKIDREFVARIGTDPVSAGITAAVTDLARVLDIAVIAEGVESADQVQALRDFGITCMQGFHFARPAPLATWTASGTTPGTVPSQRTREPNPRVPAS